jgi:hypothetical protein
LSPPPMRPGPMPPSSMRCKPRRRLAECRGGCFACSNKGMRTDLEAAFTQALRVRFPVETRREAVDRLF